MANQLVRSSKTDPRFPSPGHTRDKGSQGELDFQRERQRILSDPAYRRLARYLKILEELAGDPGSRFAATCASGERAGPQGSEGGRHVRGQMDLVEFCAQPRP